MVEEIVVEKHAGASIDISDHEKSSDPHLSHRHTVPDVSSSFSRNQREELMNKLVAKGPCQPKLEKFPSRSFGKKKPVFRSFQPSWYDTYPWISYSVSKDTVFCVYCILCSRLSKSNTYAYNGYNNWKDAMAKKGFVSHNNSAAHYQAKNIYMSMKHKKSPILEIMAPLNEADGIKNKNYALQLIKGVEYLAKCGLAFRGNNESKESHNKGNWLELIGYTANLSIEFKELYYSRPDNALYTSPEIVKELCDSYTQEIIKLIINEIENRPFALCADETADVGKKEMMAVMIRYVNRKGEVEERFVRMQHVEATDADTLFQAVLGNFYILFCFFNSCLVRLNSKVMMVLLQ